MKGDSTPSLASEPMAISINVHRPIASGHAMSPCRANEMLQPRIVDRNRVPLVCMYCAYRGHGIGAELASASGVERDGTCILMYLPR